MARRARPSPGLSWIVTWPFTLVFAAMVFITATHMNQPSNDPVPEIGGPDWEARLPGRIDAVTAALQRSSLAVPPPVEERTGSGSVRYTHRRYLVSIAPEDRAEAEVAVELLRAVDPNLTLHVDDAADGFEVKIGLDGLLTHTVHFRWQQPAVPRLAFLIDGLGDDLRLAREVVGLDAPVAIGVVPFRPFSREVAELAHLFRREVLLHFSPPAPPADPSEPSPNAGAVLGAALAGVPHVVGMTANDDLAAALDMPADASALAGELQRRNLFYVPQRSDGDPVTGHGSPALRIERRTVVIGEHEGGIEKQMRSLLERARSEGGAVGIAGARLENIDALRQAISDWRSSGVELVSLASLLGAEPPPGTPAPTPIAALAGPEVED